MSKVEVFAKTGQYSFVVGTFGREEEEGEEEGRKGVRGRGWDCLGKVKSNLIVNKINFSILLLLLLFFFSFFFMFPSLYKRKKGKGTQFDVN